MNRSLKALLAALVVAALCGALAALPNAFNPNDEGYNQRLKLVWFLGLALPGLVISGTLGLWAARHSVRQAIWIIWLSQAVLCVLLPAPAMLGAGKWADGLLWWYLLGALLAGGLYGWDPEPPSRNDSQVRP